MVSNARPASVDSIPVSRPSLGREEEVQVLDVLRSGWVGQGPKVAEFERKIAGLLGVEHAVAVNSGTAALHLALLGLGVGPGDEVIVPDFTFPAAANVVRHCGAEPILLDIELDTLNLSLDQLTGFLEEHTDPKSDGLRDTRNGRTIKAVMAVHLFGLPMAMQPILQLAERYGLAIVEDAACAFGARDATGYCGTMGNVGCFSFHPRKVITTGEGGVLVTRRVEVADHARSLRNHGMMRDGPSAVFTHIGYDFRMSDVDAAIGVAQLDKLQTILKRSDEIAGWYDTELSSIHHLHLPRRTEGRIYQAYVVLLERPQDRNQVLARLQRAGIECVPGTYAVSAQPAYEGTPSYPNSLYAQQQTVALPLHTALERPTVVRICTEFKRAIAAKGRGRPNSRPASAGPPKSPSGPAAHS